MDPTSEKLLTQLITTFKEWNSDLREIRKEYQKQVAILDEAIQNIKKQEKTLIAQLTPWIPLITLGIVLFGAGILFSTMPCGTTFNYQEIKLEKTCQ